MLIIGVGNPMRGDDGVGPLIASRLAGMLPADVVIREESGEGTRLMESWAGEDAVFVVDAVSSGSRPGAVVRFDAVEQVVPANYFRYSTHAFSLAEAVELSRALELLPPRLVIYGIEGANFAQGEGLTLKVAEAADDVARRIADEVAELSAMAAWRRAERRV